MSSDRRFGVWKLAAALLVVSACSETRGSGDAKWLHVSVNGTPPNPALQVTLSRAGGPPATLVCPEIQTASQTERCTPGGFEVLTDGGRIDGMLRAKGHAFAPIHLESESAPAVTLAPLEPSEQTADYVTGFGGDGCLNDLLSFAIPLATEVGMSYSVKFYIAGVAKEPRVYFQNTKRHPLHFDFASKVLGVAETPTEFAIHTYSGRDRAAMAGTLVYYPSVQGAKCSDASAIDAPWTLNFFPSDDITPEQVRFAHRLIEERVSCLDWRGERRRLAYLPAGTLQEQNVRQEATGFAQQGIAWLEHSALFSGISRQPLNPGLAFGTLKRMTPEELARSVVSFRDVLLLTRLPNELPIVGATITEEFQTPLSHVNVAARTRGTPNLGYPGAFADPRFAPLVGQLVRFEVGEGDFSIRQASTDEAEQFWSSRTPEPYVPPFDSSLTGIPSFEEIAFSDSLRVGVKAANLAELSRALGENAPDRGLAIPFHYYEAHLTRSSTSSELCGAARSDCERTGRDASACQRAHGVCWPAASVPESLATFIDRALDDSGFREDTTLRDAVLANLRYLIEHSALDPDFADLLDRRVAELFGGAKVKLRSSTNCEDLPNFSGAGLYESHGARATGDDAPSRVVAKVFASAWTFRGFEERSYWNIDHRAVRMGCAINGAFSNERANGVLITANIADPGVEGMYINVQKGEESVTNPTNGTLPEVFSIIAAPAGIQVARQRFSSVSPDAPLLTQSEVESLYQAASKAQAHFAPLYGLSPRQMILDIEFKLTAEGKIVFKQARPFTTAPR